MFSTMVSEDVLNRVSGNAIRLYVYLGHRGVNETGECWITIETMARYFKKSKRTVSYWLSELENVGLIKRIQFNLDESAHTFLRPYGSKHFRPMDSALNTGDVGLDEIGSNDSEQR
ncbi:helix-turn-helix domain-containing protein [Sulfoacidibacillus ferrooxidans]|uniref:Helix-turn-helix domain-containing protein n=1 Tax=Sulfoacidibacillus ferrooxidans TaxID=2005001 RepID=A0A9X2AG06_9BACL|nr:hypothetical protein [Sulfoacidibacillus ferrooxidans]